MCVSSLVAILSLMAVVQADSEVFNCNNGYKMGSGCYKVIDIATTGFADNECRQRGGVLASFWPDHGGVKRSRMDLIHFMSYYTAMVKKENMTGIKVILSLRRNQESGEWEWRLKDGTLKRFNGTGLWDDEDGTGNCARVGVNSSLEMFDCSQSSPTNRPLCHFTDFLVSILANGQLTDDITCRSCRRYPEKKFDELGESLPFRRRFAGQNLALECHGYSLMSPMPHVSLHWSRMINDKPVSANVSMLKEKLGEYSSAAVDTVTNATVNDSGTYTCHGSVDGLKKRDAVTVEILPNKNCDGGLTVGSLCYKPVDLVNNETDVHYACMRNGGDLAVLDTPNLMQEMLKTYDNTSANLLEIALIQINSKGAKEGSWQWVLPDGNLKKMRGHPPAGAEDGSCAGIWHGTLTRHHCDPQHHDEDEQKEGERKALCQFDYEAMSGKKLKEREPVYVLTPLSPAQNSDVESAEMPASFEK